MFVDSPLVTLCESYIKVLSQTLGIGVGAVSVPSKVPTLKQSQVELRSLMLSTIPLDVYSRNKLCKYYTTFFDFVQPLIEIFSQGTVGRGGCSHPTYISFHKTPK